MAKSSVATGRSKALVRRETRSAYLFLLPNLIFFVGFVVIPMILCVYTSFLIPQWVKMWRMFSSD